MMYYSVVSAVVAAGTSIYLNNKNQSAARSAARMQMTATEKAAADARAASEQASAMMATATTEAAAIQASAARYAADRQYKAAMESLAIQKMEWEKMQTNMAPYLKTGKAGLNQLAYGLGLPGTKGTGELGYLQKAFDEQSFADNFEKTPGYEFRLSEGIKALDRSASARGNLLSGQQLKGIERFSQDYATNEYQNAYNRAYSNYVQNQDAQYNHLANLASLGQNTAVQVGNAGANYANNYGEILLGATTAANNYNMQGAAAQANALTQGAQYGGNALMQGAQYGGNAAVANANTLANLELAKAASNTSMYQGIGNSLSNLLGQYYANRAYNSQNSIPTYYGSGYTSINN